MPFYNFSSLNISGNLNIEPRLIGPSFSVAQIAKTVSTGKAFGFSMSSDNTNVIVGAYNSASAYIYGYNGTAWVLTATFTKTGRFGYKVAIDGEWAAIANSPVSGDGNVYMYRRVNGTWVEHSTISTPDTSIGSLFGTSVALNNGSMVIGQTRGNVVGGAYVYVFNGSAWVKQSGFLSVATASTRAGSNQNFGIEVSIYGDTVVVGGSGDTIGKGNGMAFVSKRTGSTWSAPALIRPDTNYADGYGFSVKIRQGKVVVGAPYGNATDKIPGRVFLYDVTGVTPVLEKTFTVKTDKSELIQDTAMTTADSFGWAVDINPDMNLISVGSLLRNGNRGATYVYEKFNNVWGPSALPNSRLDASDATTTTRFGSSTAFTQNGILVGAYGVNAFYWFK